MNELPGNIEKKAPGKDAALTQAQRLKQLQMILDVSRQVASLETLDAVLDTLVTVAVETTGAERGSLFLHDASSGELYSRIAQGMKRREIRILDTIGIAGTTFQSGEGLIIHDPYTDPRFNKDVDAQTGFTTTSILASPIRNARGETIGVAQVLNKVAGEFNEQDLQVLEGITSQCAITLESMQLVERMEDSRRREIEFLNIVSEMTSELELTTLLRRVMTEATSMLDAERSTLFINDEKTAELFSHVGEGLDAMEIRLPNHLGIAGSVFTSGEAINIPHAYTDLRFNPAFDKQSGFFTRSILCVPVVNKSGETIGVTQVLNKRGGPFNEEDESRLKAFTAQIAIGLENAKLFADIQSMKNYNESMLQSMSNGVITFDEEGANRTCNQAGARILRCEPDELIGKSAAEVLGEENQWLIDKIARVSERRTPESLPDTELVFAGETVSANVTVLPMESGEGTSLGTLAMIEDISDAKRAKSTLSRYMDPGLASQMLAGGGEDDILGGKDTTATVLFSDIRGFTTITEKLGAQGTVALLNDYFELMVDCISEQGGMLDKFIGDAIMAAFGIPVGHDDDEDRGLRAGINMISELWRWNGEREARGEMPLDMGLGLNTDRIVAGNIGSKKRMDYTMIGDGVNLAARLESACKQYSARILLSEYTVAKLKGVYRLREVDRVVVKGKSEPVGVFECLDYHSDATFPNLMDVLGNFNEGVKLYRGQEWDRAAGYFKKAMEANPEDKLSQTYIDRCQLMKDNPPGDEWDGVWIMKEK
ncbi:Adenylate/Guanylate Cyclase [Erythrobacter sp. NAP1]|uniref:GAF domain-containing protein n=1 Tax=Erythrobacter sp. NAP1 TaxID=237727 RepID=UPI0000686CB4|nr:GAF domain-containing protein [Erythrobacter sp. NAP1]EAQ29335.1 Adenylate/Guanylate Cyclase [Erythrobacter sp. NAP1]